MYTYALLYAQIYVVCYVMTILCCATLQIVFRKHICIYIYICYYCVDATLQVAFKSAACAEKSDLRNLSAAEHSPREPAEGPCIYKSQNSIYK